MKFPVPSEKVSDAPVSQRRRHGRVRTDDVPSTLGRVIDLSGSGMRVEGGRRRLETGAVIDVGIQGVDGPFLIRAKVVRVTRKGLMGSEIALEFDAPGDGVRAELLELARQAVAAPMFLTYRAAA